MARGGIDPFAGLQAHDVPAEPTEAIPQILQRRPSRAKRNREWERKNKVTAYRGIPPELNDAMKDIAIKLSISIGDVARAFLEHGIEAYNRGDLALAPRPRYSTYSSMTLYPQDTE